MTLQRQIMDIDCTNLLGLTARSLIAYDMSISYSWLFLCLETIV
jgi:hypothetical protein